MGKAAWRCVVKALCASFDRLEHAIQRFDRHRNGFAIVEVTSLGGAPATEYQSDAEAARNFENHLRGIEPKSVAEQIVVISHRRRARQQHLGQSDPGSDSQRLLIDLRPKRIRDRTEPACQRKVDAGSYAFQDTLEQMMMG